MDDRLKQAVEVCESRLRLIENQLWTNRLLLAAIVTLTAWVVIKNR